MNEELVIKQFAAQMTTEFAVNKVTFYRNGQKIYGDTLNNILLERCLAVSCTSIFKEPEGSCMVTKIYLGNTQYLCVLESKTANAFDGLDAQYIVEEVKNLKRKLGDM